MRSQAPLALARYAGQARIAPLGSRQRPARQPEIVRLVCFPCRQTTTAGEREVKKALRESLVKYQRDQAADLFEPVYGCIRQYYRA